MTSSNHPPVEERFLRSASIIDQDKINQQPVTIIGVGAIGSHLAEMLVKMGVLRLTLIDPDEVDTVNLGVQGFYECEVGLPKVEAVQKRLKAIHSKIEVESHIREYQSDLIPARAALFCCIDSIRTRRSIFRDFCNHDWAVLFDGRMAAETLRVFCIEKDPKSLQQYRDSLFPSHEAYRESCTARATIYCATMAAAILCAQYKRWAMKQEPEVHLQFDILSFDCIR